MIRVGKDCQFDDFSPIIQRRLKEQNTFMNLFIDTNVYLTFYHYSSDDLEQLKKLLVAIQSGQVKLWLPNQVIDEFGRNREVKIADALRLFNEQKLPDKFPQICKGYDGYQHLIDAVNAYSHNKSVLIDNLKEDVTTKNLGADKLIGDLFEAATIIEVTSEIVSKAKLRYDLGNPPGKVGSYGDAINWECLLATVIDTEDVCFVARDKDYLSAIDKTKFSDYLSEEWNKKKHSKIIYYITLTDFFSAHFPDIRLAIDMQRRFAVQRLMLSNSFASTHFAIRGITNFADFTDQEVQNVVDSCLDNSQISTIAEDEDVSDFVSRLVTTYSAKIPPEKLEQLTHIYLSSPVEPPEDDINPPF